jgi:hypothetical protein
MIVPSGHTSTDSAPACFGARMAHATPDGSGLAQHRSVLFLTADDGLADTIRTRAGAAGADVRRIYVHDERGNPSSFELQQDLVLLAEKVQEVGDVALVIIDPITAYMGAGKIDTHKTADVRAVLSLLRDFADQHGVAVIGLTHPSKSVNKAMNAATGSQAFVAASRATWLFARETDEEVRRPAARSSAGQEQPIGQAQQRARLPSRRLRSRHRHERAVSPVGGRSGHDHGRPGARHGDGGRELQRRRADRRRCRLPS